MKGIRKGLTIRRFQVQDQEQSRKILLAGLGEHFEELDLRINPDLDDIFSHYILPGHVFLVAEHDGQIVGTGGLVRENDGIGRLVRLSVNGPHRGKGIGRAIVSRLVELATALGFHRVVVETNHDWFAAIRLYANCHFIEYDRDDVSVHMMLLLS